MITMVIEMVPAPGDLKRAEWNTTEKRLLSQLRNRYK
jgi:hypothetical protein